MGPNDQYPNYYYNNSTDQPTQPTYGNYQSRTNQSYQHSRQPSAATTPQTYPTFQQQTTPVVEYDSNDQAHAYNNPAWSATSGDGGTRAAATLSRMGTSSVEQTSHSGTTHTNTTPNYPYATGGTSYNQTQATNAFNSAQNAAATTQYPSAQTQPTTQYSSTTNQTSNYASIPTYATAQPPAQAQARPSGANSVGSNSIAAQRSPVFPEFSVNRPNTGMQQYQRTQILNTQRSASPAQIQASHQLKRLQAEGCQSAESSAPAAQTQSFVDPSAVYNPWPEYQRKLAAARAAKEIEDRLAAEQEAEERRKEEEEATNEAAEQLRKEEEENEKKKEAATTAKKAKAKERRKSNANQKKGGASASDVAAAGMDLSQLSALADQGGDAEAQIRQLMAVVKKMNDKHPALLAKIWEQERQQHIETSDSAQSPAAPALQSESSQSMPKKKRAPKGSGSISNASTSASTNGTKAPAESTASAQTKAIPNPAASAPKPASPNLSAKAAPPKAGKKGTTIWPPEKKGLLAASAAAWLNAVPENRTREITTSAVKISRILDTNPTYIELCETMEKMGLKFDRAAFAKALLKTVPDVNSKHSAASSAIPRPPSIPGQSSSAFPPPALHPRPTPVAVAQDNRANMQPPTSADHFPSNTLSVPTYESPYFDNRDEEITTAKVPTPKHSRKQSEGKKPESEPKSERASETPGPVTKADAARKRTFADLVDLTALSDDDDLPPAKQAYLGPPPIRDSGVNYQTTPHYDYLPNFRGIVDPYLQQGSQQRWSGPSQHQFQQRPAIPDNRLSNNMDLVKQISRKNALRRSGYDIRTIARDILLATGKHPDLLPLNGHLEGLRSAFPKSFDTNADLSTIRWDLIDPGDPIPSAFDTLRSDDKDSVIDDDADDESDDGEQQAPQQLAVRQAITASGGSIPTPFSFNGYELNSTLISNKTTPTRGRGRGRLRGRPPIGIRNSTSGMRQTPVGNHNPNNPTTPGSYSASPAPPVSGGSIGYSAFNRDVRPDGTKRRGRPVGWRKNLHQKGVGALAAGATPGSGSAKAGPSTTPTAEPKFPVYKCGWKRCNAELHNLDTLRRHVRKIHSNGDKAGKFTCFWEGCGKNVPLLDADTGAVTQIPQQFNFPDSEELLNHVGSAHLGPIAWKMGDGPVGGFSDSNASDAEPYLADFQGRRVTPQVPAAALRSSGPGSTQRTPGQSRGRPPKKTDEEKAKESQAELARRKNEIGLGVDRQGATFANEKRRAGFVDDEEGGEVIIEDSD